MDRRVVVVGGIAALVVVGVPVIIQSGVLDRSSDEAKIERALRESIEASREGRAGGVLEHLSRDFELNGTQWTGGQIAQRIRESRPDVAVESTPPRIELDGSAVIEAPVELKLRIPPVALTLDRVEIRFRKVTERALLIFPVSRWQMASVRIPESTYQNLANQTGLGPD